MKMKSKTTWAAIVAVLIPLAVGAVLFFPSSRAVFLKLTAEKPYWMGFVKFALLATTGEILASKVSAGVFSFPKGVLAKAAVWGLIGMMITLSMPLYSGGVQAAQTAGLLFGKNSAFFTALITSAVMNVTFGIAMMAFHRVTDTMVEQYFAEKKISPINAIGAVDWVGFIRFVIGKTILLFWIPAHTITFLLPAEYRVFASAVLSIALGLLMAIAKRKK